MRGDLAIKATTDEWKNDSDIGHAKAYPLSDYIPPPVGSTHIPSDYKRWDQKSVLLGRLRSWDETISIMAKHMINLPNLPPLFGARNGSDCTDTWIAVESISPVAGLGKISCIRGPNRPFYRFRPERSMLSNVQASECE